MKRFVEKKTGYFKSFDGTQIYYEMRGQGQPLVFLYGIACPMNHWLPQIEFFSHQYKTIIMDYRGYYMSSLRQERGNKDISLSAIVQDVKALMGFLSIKKATFLGHSFGGQILVAAYKVYPDLFKSFILVNGFVSDPFQKMKGRWIIQVVFLLIEFFYSLFPRMISKLWKAVVRSRFVFLVAISTGGFNKHLTERKNIEIYLSSVASIYLIHFFPLFREMRDYDGLLFLKEIEVPCLFIGGKKDTLTPEEVQRHMHQQVKESELFIATHGTHCTQLDEPDLVNRRVVEFLKKHHSKKK